MRASVAVSTIKIFNADSSKKSGKDRISSSSKAEISGKKKPKKQKGLAGTTDYRTLVTTPDNLKLVTNWLMKLGPLLQFSLAAEHLYQ